MISKENIPLLLLMLEGHWEDVNHMGPQGGDFLMAAENPEWRALRCHVQVLLEALLQGEPDSPGLAWPPVAHS